MTRTSHLTPDEADRLIRNFFDGATSNAEEQALYAYFAQPRLPARHEAERGLFAYFAAGLQKAPARPARPARPRRFVTLRRWVAGAAAAVALVGGGVAFWHHERVERWEALYAGSYRIEDGRRTTDVRSLMPYIRQSLADARQLHAEQRLLDRQRQERLENLGTDMTQGIDDPELQKEIEEICKLP